MRKWLVDIRKAYGLTQKRMARAAGISQPVYNRIELGRANPSVKTAKRIAGMFGFEWTKFFDEVSTDNEDGRSISDESGGNSSRS